MPISPKALLRASIWGPDGVDAADVRMERLLRRTLPEFDIACALFGVFGLLGGVPAVDDTFLPVFGTVWASALIGASLACLVGVAYPSRLWRLELWCKALLVSIILIYAAAIVYAAFVNDDIGRGGVAALVYATTALPRWRMTDIARDRRVHQWR